MTKISEKALLCLAVQRGLLSPADLVAEIEPLDSAEEDAIEVQFGRRLDSLVRRRRISAKEVQALLTEAHATQVEPQTATPAITGAIEPAAFESTLDGAREPAPDDGERTSAASTAAASTAASFAASSTAALSAAVVAVVPATATAQANHDVATLRAQLRERLRDHAGWLLTSQFI